LAAAEALRHDPSGPARAQLDQLYAEMSDPATGEPEARSDASALRSATDALHDASSAEPHDAALHRLLGEYLLASGLNRAAVTELQAAASQGEDMTLLAVPLAFALLRSDRLEELIALPTPPSLPPHQLAMLRGVQARALEAMNRYPDAATMLQQALAAEPNDLDAVVRLGLLNLWHGDRSLAAQWLEQATRIDPASVATLRLRGEYAYATRDFAGSAAAYDKLVAMGAPERLDPPPILGLARAQIYQGDLHAAEATLAHPALPGNDPMLGYYRALLAYRSGAFQRASELAEPLIGPLNDYPAVHLLLGAAMLASGYPATARHYLAHYVAVVPDNRVAPVLLAEADERVAHPDTPQPIAPGQLYAALGFAATAANGWTAP
jgi:tetratricopeptide (TPR) repeat protein